jgi:hypothetical protein
MPNWSSVCGPDFSEMSADEVAQVVEASPPNDCLDRSSERCEKVGPEVPAGAGELAGRVA